MNEELVILIEEYVNNTKQLSPTEIILLAILYTLRDMKKQERDYWEEWKQRKEKEQ